jgi:sterol desaturase/sphingolipid hydroxylase (fatty acid hydroxylase superfamily)
MNYQGAETDQPESASESADDIKSSTWLARLSRTKTNGRLGLICDAAISFALIALAAYKYRMPAASSYAAVLLGLALFTFIEYAFHRWLFHGKVATLRRGHWQHHLFPLGDDSLPFFIPPLILALLAYVLTAIIPGSMALLFVGGLAAGYAAYGISHIVIHSTRFNRPGPRNWAAAHHIHHHHPDKNFGVTTPLWDVILGTRYVSAHLPPTREPTAH